MAQSKDEKERKPKKKPTPAKEAPVEYRTGNDADGMPGESIESRKRSPHSHYEAKRPFEVAIIWKPEDGQKESKGKPNLVEREPIIFRNTAASSISRNVKGYGGFFVRSHFGPQKTVY